ncbi:unnamed protein product [Didymodactylos carnosus]|uniref:Uncharacterized protein n=1 Tax=Didymodactylos carnosus TaxID=1234261 RepID=A0A814QU71_9BILA|nr:unnamed protein product [Didymodactylos carnosus]CAF1124561.1 unnamed protein product [Didymodactylos carnosus]CAF3706531.1 unnamed protein product [Didymodactylos carnosus]CAF3888036.1 unnamed protein product [Didymodactylos carnosus]
MSTSLQTTSYERDDVRWNPKGYYERYDGRKYWRKLCVVENCSKRAKTLSWCKRHYTEEKQKQERGEGDPNICLEPQRRQSKHNYQRYDIRINKKGIREQFDGKDHWRELCLIPTCTKRAKKLAFCKRHFTEQIKQETN